MTQIEKWDRRFLQLADTIAGWSKDPSSKVGAVIADTSNRVVSLGYNGLPKLIVDDETRLADRDMRLLMTVHAEPNAILFAARNLCGTTIYVTHHPCSRCAALIVQSGISRVVTREPEAGFALRWKDDILLAQRMFDEAGVMLEEVGCLKSNSNS